MKHYGPTEITGDLYVDGVVRVHSNTANYWELDREEDDGRLSISESGTERFSISQGGQVTANGGFRVTGDNTFAQGKLYKDTNYGTLLTGATGSVTDFGIMTAAGNWLLNNPTGTTSVYLSSHNIAFPVTQVPSADANTLDDYEEGTWNPAVGADGSAPTGQTYNTRSGRYIKIGKLVLASFSIVLTARGTSGTYTTITGLPFTAGARGGGAVTYWAGFTTNHYSVTHLDVVAGSTYAYLHGSTGAAAAAHTVIFTEFGNALELYGTMSYEASA